MSWAVGICQESRPQKLLMLSDEKELIHTEVTSLGKHGVPAPKATKRIVYTGDFSSWVRDSADRYLKCFDIELPAAVANRHAVFCFSLEDGTRVHVPALVLIRGLFKPSNWMPPAVFTPGNFDNLGFVDYSCNPPNVVLDLEQGTNKRDAGSCTELLSWIHTSHSARRSAQSVYLHSLEGFLDLALPLGEFRLVLHGKSIGSNLFVTKMCPISTRVQREDSVAKTERSFFFHQMASSSRKVTPLTQLPLIPLRDDRQVELNDREWDRIHPLLKTRSGALQRYCRRNLLNSILLKLATANTWKSISASSGITVLNLTATFRKWQFDGRFTKVLTELYQLRQPSR